MGFCLQFYLKLAFHFEIEWAVFGTEIYKYV